MIPHFPEFKKLEFEDKADIEKFTHTFAPYSDFNFMSMWSWDIQGEKYVSELNGNLVVRFDDYITGEIFYSFLGNNMPNETAEMLLDFSVKEGLPAILKLLPEDSIRGLDAERFEIIEDRDNHDYIYDVDVLLRMDGGKFKSKRRHLKFFEENFPHAVIKEINLNDQFVKDEIVHLSREWAQEKGKSSDESENELQAISRFLDSHKPEHFIAVGIYIDGKLVAVSKVEKHDDHATYHFKKALTSSFRGIEPYLMRGLVKILDLRGVKYLNREQDLGIPGLRESKESYGPSRYLKKFRLSPLPKKETGN